MTFEYEAPPFRPLPGLRGAHFQTLWSNLLRRPDSVRAILDRSHTEILGTVDGDRLRVHWTAGQRRAGAPVLVILHGLTGCSSSSGVLGVAAKALGAGFEVVRVDLRNAFGSTPSVGVGHAGRSEDARTVLEHVVSRRPSSLVAIVGFSLGGNVALKAAGEYGSEPPTQLRAVVGISVPLDLDRACTRIDAASNWLYRRYFLGRLRRIVAGRIQAHPDVYEGVEPPPTLSIRDFDDAIVAPTCGFTDAVDYYTRSSAIAFLPDIRVPTLLVEAEDDPFIPFSIYEDARIRDNPRVCLLNTRRGGHAGFWNPNGTPDPTPFWAEHRAVEFAARRVA